MSVYLHDEALKADERREGDIESAQMAYVRGRIDFDTMERWLDRAFGLEDDRWEHWAGVWTRKASLA